MYQMIIQNSDTGDIFDVSTMVSSIEHYTSILGQPGRLSFILEKDPNNILELSPGSTVMFKTEEGGVFFGYIFTLGTDATEAYKVVAYDQTRYLKNKDTMFVENQTASQLFQTICTRTNIKRSKIVTPSSYVLNSQLFNNKTYFEILDIACKETLQQDPSSPYYFVRDNFGTLEFNELMATKTINIIGDGSLLTDYQYEVDIDKDTFTRVKVMKGSQEKGFTIAHIEQDIPNIAKWGMLQELVTVTDETSDAQLQSYAKLFLQLKNRARKTIKINALGCYGLNAGDGFLFQLSKLGINEFMFIISATHNYDADLHTMTLEVSQFANSDISFKKTDYEIALEVIDGKWGNGTIRKVNLLSAGYDYNTIQSIVNNLLG